MSESTQDFISEVKGCLEYHSRGFIPLKITNFAFFCYKGHRVSDLGKIDTSLGTNFDGMFSNCTFTTAPLVNTSAGKSGVSMFQDCKNMVDMPNYDFHSFGNTAYMFSNCAMLTHVPDFGMAKITWSDQMFKGCSALTTISGLDLSSKPSLTNFLLNCSALTTLYIYNVLTSITIGSGTTYGHLLSVDSLVHTIQELITASTMQTLSMGSANLEKIANLYCKVTDNTNTKITMEICESTDEGAMLLSEYAALKNWQFA